MSKTIIITGTSRGIGFELVLQALEQGHKIVGISRIKPSINHKRYWHYVCDLSDVESLEKTYKAIVKQQGAPDVFIHNAGFSMDSLMLYTDDSELVEVNAVNLSSAFLLSRYFIKGHLASHTMGNIVYVGSIASSGAPSNASYSMAKGGLVGLMNHIKHAYTKSGIIISMAILGFVETTMTKQYALEAKQVLIEGSSLKRAGSITEVADGILGLSCLKNKRNSGQIIHYSGGMLDFPLGKAGE